MMMIGDDWDFRYGVRPKPDARTQFKTLLRMSAKNDDLITRVLEIVENLFKISNLESFPWKIATAVSKEPVADAVQRLTQRQAQDVRILPVHYLIFAGGALVQDNFQKRLTSEVDRGSLCYSEGELIRFRLQAARFSWGFADELKSDFLEALWQPLSAAFSAGMEKVSRAHGFSLVWPAMAKMIYYYICCGILADKDSRITMQRYEHVIYLFSKGVVLLGEERGQTGVWYALAG